MNRDKRNQKRKERPEKDWLEDLEELKRKYEYGGKEKGKNDKKERT